jgi:beta-barrel assembly-enhancing protease
MQFKALAYHDDFTDGRISGQIRIDGDKFIFQSTDREYIVLKKDALLDHGGTAGRQIFISSKTNSVKFSTADAGILKTDFFSMHESLAQQSTKIRQKRSLAKLSIIGGVAVFFLSIFSIIIFRKTIVKYIAKGIPYSLEQTLGKSYVTQMALTEDLDSTSVAYKELDAKIKLLVAKVDPKYQIKTYIVKSEEINAFALPGGFLVFNSELLKKADSWEEVLGVASHEIAHVTQQHHARGVLSRVGVFTILSILLGDGSALTDLVFGAGSTLEGLSYSRDYETESDIKGFEYMIAAHVNPKGLRTFFAKLEKADKLGSKVPALLSTHPSNNDRIEDIKKLEAKKNNQIDFIKLDNYGNFKEILNQKVKEVKEK